MSRRCLLLCFLPLLGLNLFGQDSEFAFDGELAQADPVAIEVPTSEVPFHNSVQVVEAITEPIFGKHEGIRDGHMWIDLGLPSGTKWATMNVGANDEKDYGYYIAWGEVEPKKVYNEKTSLTSGKSIRRICGKSRYDAVTHHWGRNWRLPTEDQIVELVNYTDSHEVKNEEDKTIGVLLKSKINGATIYFPYGGMKGDDMVYAVGDMGFYWTGSEFSTVWDKACFLMVSPYGARLSDDLRCVGINVRGVLTR